MIALDEKSEEQSHGNLSNSCLDISVWTKVLDQHWNAQDPNLKQQLVDSAQIPLQLSGDDHIWIQKTKWAICLSSPSSCCHPEFVKSSYRFWQFKTGAHFIPQGNMFLVYEVSHSVFNECELLTFNAAIKKYAFTVFMPLSLRVTNTNTHLCFQFLIWFRWRWNQRCCRIPARQSIYPVPSLMPLGLSSQWSDKHSEEACFF